MTALDMHAIPIEGRDGQTWRHDWRSLDNASARIATCYYGEDESDNPVFVKRFHDADLDDVARMMQEFECLKVLADCPNVIRLVGAGQTRTEDWCLVFEMADTVLEGQAPSAELAESIRRDIGAALECVHGHDLVHSDVAPNNIVRVDGAWKLTDFDNCVPRGRATSGQPASARYLAPGRQCGDAADPAFDLYGLDAVVEQFVGTR
jgi:serine/threonine protein kinase